MNKLQALRKLFLSEVIGQTPRKREYGGDWVEVTVGIGKDHTAYISMPSDSLEELLKMTEATEE